MNPKRDSKRIESKPASKAEDGSARAESKRRALGKGLESLLSGQRNTAAAPSVPEEGSPRAGSSGDSGGKPREIPLSEIDVNPYQTRKSVGGEQLEELTRSIEANGVVQPIIVRPLPNGRFQLVAGERRWRASGRAGRATVPAILRQVSDQQAMEMTIVENLQRADLNPMEQARAYDRLSREFKLTQEQMALRTGKERATVGNFLRLLRLPEEAQTKVEAGELSFGHARALVALESTDAILKAAAKVNALSMSVRQTESYVQGVLNPERRASDGEGKAKQPLDANVQAIQDQLQRHLGLKVRIEDKNGRGKVVIQYSRLEDFDSIMKALGGSQARGSQG